MDEMLLGNTEITHDELLSRFNLRATQDDIFIRRPKREFYGWYGMKESATEFDVLRQYGRFHPGKYPVLAYLPKDRKDSQNLFLIRPTTFINPDEPTIEHLSDNQYKLACVYWYIMKTQWPNKEYIANSIVDKFYGNLLAEVDDGDEPSMTWREYVDANPNIYGC